MKTVNSPGMTANEDEGHAKVRAVAKVPPPPAAPPRAPAPQQRGVARVSPEAARRTGRIYLTEPERPPVFVDDSGRRGRWLTWLAVILAVLGLALLVALWVSQVASTGA
jgi:hypothetical protein